MSFRYTLVFVVAFVATVVASARADVFVLKNGGRIQGQWLNSDQKPAGKYVIRTAAGVELTVDAAQIAEAQLESTDVHEYERLAPGFANTVADQWKLAEWCRERKLPEQRRRHLERIVELDPDYAPARRALGFSLVAGEWVTPEGHRAKQGYRYFRGRWRLPQEIELIENREKAAQIERDWVAKIRRWRQDLFGTQAAEARRQILAIRDPAAVKPLAELITTEPVRAVKLLYLDVLGEIRNGPAKNVMVLVVFSDPDVEMFHAAVDKLVPLKTPEMVEVFVQALKQANNVRLNRAAYVIGRLNEPSTIPALIDVLVTTHKVTTPGRGSPDAITSVFPNAERSTLPVGNGSFQFGNGNQTRLETVPNQEVLNTLVRFSRGVSFGFDPPAWHRWYANEVKNRSEP